MQLIFDIDSNRKAPKYLQIVHSVTRSIKLGKLKKGDRLLSINELSNEFLLARDTVQKAYNILQKNGILLPVKGKGFYINRTDITVRFRILMLFNKISIYKNQVYTSFIKSIGKEATVDLKIYDSNTRLFEDIITNHLNDYDYFVVMPHFYEHTDKAIELIRQIPRERLLLIDKDIQYMPSDYTALYQDFATDIIGALEEGRHLLGKYTRLILVYPKFPRHPREIVDGFRTFCQQYNFSHSLLDKIGTETVICKNQAYIVLEEPDLVALIKKCQSKGLKVGKQIGIIAYNDTLLKEILLGGITVITTDHGKLGESAARCILENKREKIRNPFSLIIRKTL